MSNSTSPKRRSRIPGYVIRDPVEGHYIGCQCPITKKQFFGDDAERLQYEHTKEIFDCVPGAYDALPIPDIARIWKGQQ